LRIRLAVARYLQKPAPPVNDAATDSSPRKSGARLEKAAYASPIVSSLNTSCLTESSSNFVYSLFSISETCSTQRSQSIGLNTRCRTGGANLRSSHSGADKHIADSEVLNEVSQIVLKIDFVCANLRSSHSGAEHRVAHYVREDDGDHLVHLGLDLFPSDQVPMLQSSSHATSVNQV
jgi:hypothetical protein